MEGQKDIVAAIRALEESLSQRHGENVERHDETDKKVDEALRRLDELLKAFPGGDWDGHRRYHESVIRKVEARTKLFEDLRGHLLKNGLWVCLAFLAWAVMQAIKAKVIS
jgi:hypothetical protein